MSFCSQKLKEENAHPDNAPATIVDGSMPSGDPQTQGSVGPASPPPVTYSQPPKRNSGGAGKSKSKSRGGGSGVQTAAEMKKKKR